MKIPAQIRAGDTVKWRDDAAADGFGNAITSTTWVLTYYLRTNTASEGATVVGTAYGTGWEFTIATGTSAAFDAGQWYWFDVKKLINWEWPENTGSILISQERVQDIDNISDWNIAEIKYELINKNI